MENIKLDVNETYISINGYAVPFSTMPCKSCDSRYELHCPRYKWCQDAAKRNESSYISMTLKEIRHSKGILPFNKAIKEKINDSNKEI